MSSSSSNDIGGEDVEMTLSDFVRQSNNELSSGLGIGESRRATDTPGSVGLPGRVPSNVASKKSE